MKAVNVDDVLKILNKYGKYIFVTDGKRYSDMVDEIANLKELQEHCDDCISRQAVIDTKICDGISCNECSFNTCEDGQAGCLLKERVDKLPSVAPQPKMGRWITKIKSDIRDDMWPTNPKCSECGGEPYYSNNIYDYKFCPYCGAKMKGEADGK